MSKSPGNDPIAAEIQAEIADHLATAAEKLQSQGIPTEEARQKSQAKFGDPETIGRRCYWIKQGDALMFRTAIIVLLTLLCCALGLVAFSGYRSQRQMAEQMTALAEQLKALADQQRVAATPSPTAETKPLEITGKVFLGLPEKPASQTEVMICRVSDGETVRRVTTTGSGEFRSGPLTAGDYTLLTKGSEKVSSDGPVGIQTAPIYLYPGGQAATAEIDARYHFGQIHVKLSNPLPNLRSEGKYVIASRLYLSARPSPSIVRSTRWVAAYPTPNQWPVYVRHCESPPPPLNPPKDFHGPYDSSTYAVMTNDEIANSTHVDFLSGMNPLPAGSCSLLAMVVSDVAPDGPFDLDEMVRSRGSSTFSGLPGADRQWMSSHWVCHGGKGGIWHTKLLEAAASSAPQSRNRRGPLASNLLQGSSLPTVYPGRPFVSEIVIGDGQLTRLEIEVPPDLQSSIQNLVETVTDPAEFSRIVQEKDLLVCRVKITALGTEPLTQPPAE